MKENLSFKIWSGKLCLSICFTKNEDFKTIFPLSNYLINIPRIYYYPLILPKLQKLFINKIHHFWLEFQGIPLKWNIPVGTLHDKFSCGPEPWSVTLHLDDFPANIIMFDDIKYVFSYFMSSLKESEYLKDNGQIISKLNPQEINKLWEYLVDYDYFGFFNTINLLNQSPQGFHFIPFKIYYKELVYQKRFQFFNTDIKLIGEDESQNYNTLGDLLNFLKFTENYDNKENLLPAKIGYSDVKFYKKIISQGIELNVNMQLLCLYLNLKNPDNLLHIVLI